MGHPFLDTAAASLLIALVLGFGGSEAHLFSVPHALAALAGTATGLGIARLHTRPPLSRLAVAGLCGVTVGYGLFAALVPARLVDASDLLREACIIFFALMLGFGVSRISAGPALPPRREASRRPE